MVRIARIVVPDIPHHITQRGNRRQDVFFSDQDRRHYLSLLQIFSAMHDLQIWGYCLMTNHVHVVAVPKTKEGLVRCFQELHQVYTRAINFREGWSGCLWQGRYSSFPMDERYLIAAIRYVECNPVAAGIVARAEDYPWSSARAHVHKSPNPVLSPCYLLDQIEDWGSFLKVKDAAFLDSYKGVTHTGRPLGSEHFVQRVEKELGRDLKKKKPGPKINRQNDTIQPVMDLLN